MVCVQKLSSELMELADKPLLRRKDGIQPVQPIAPNALKWRGRAPFTRPDRFNPGFIVPMSRAVRTLVISLLRLVLRPFDLTPCEHVPFTAARRFYEPLAF